MKFPLLLKKLQVTNVQFVGKYPHNLALDMKLDEFIKKKLFNFLFIILIFGLDQVSKYLVLDYFSKSSDQIFVVNSLLSINLIWNNGIAFGFFQFRDPLYYNIISFFIFVILIFIIWLSFKSKGLEKISYLMILGGGLGNLFDRLYHGSVIDFIDLNYKSFHWFVFNIADIFISVGVFALILVELFRKKND